MAEYLNPRDRDLKEPENNLMRTSAMRVGMAADKAMTSLRIALLPIEIVNTKSMALLTSQEAPIMTKVIVLE